MMPRVRFSVKTRCLSSLQHLRRLQALIILMLVLAFGAAGVVRVAAQTVQPLMAEYTEGGEGSFEVSNTGLAASVVVLEPKSFSIRPDGLAEFRPLDNFIHLQLSATSFRLEPRESARVFYKVTADAAPAWFSVYASFSPAKAAKGLSVRVMLPHTVYLYQKRPLSKEALEVRQTWFDPDARKVECRIANKSGMAGRALSVEVTGGRSSAAAGGFPLLPHSERVLSVDWSAPEPPRAIEIDFDRFSLHFSVEPGK